MCQFQHGNQEQKSRGGRNIRVLYYLGNLRDRLAKQAHGSKPRPVTCGIIDRRSFLPAGELWGSLETHSRSFVTNTGVTPSANRAYVSAPDRVVELVVLGIPIKASLMQIQMTGSSRCVRLRFDSSLHCISSLGVSLSMCAFLKSLLNSQAYRR